MTPERRFLGGGGGAAGALVPALSSYAYRGIVGTFAVSASEQTIYTVPSGKKALLFRLQYFYSSGTPSPLVYLVPSGQSANDPNNKASTPSLSAGPSNPSADLYSVLSAGDTVQVNTQSFNASSLNYALNVIEFPSSEPMFGVFRSQLASGADNTVYTVPTGKSALVAPIIEPVLRAGWVYNNAVSSQALRWKVTPSGGSLTQIRSDTYGSKATGSPLNVSFPAGLTLGAGDALVVNPNGSGFNVWLVGLEH